MRVYKHPDRPGWIVAEQGNLQIEAERSALPTSPEEAVAFLRAKFVEAEIYHDPDTGNPVPSPEPPGTYVELDIDSEAVETTDFEVLAGEIVAEVQWLDDTIPQIDAMTVAEVRAVVKRLAQENKRMLKAWRYVIRRLK